MTTETTTLHLPTMHCAGCMNTVQKELKKAGAVIAASDMETKSVTVQFETEKLTRTDLVAAMEAVGFPPGEEA